MKVCRACGEEKAFSEFYKNPGGKFGLTGRCKVCHRKSTKEWHEKNAESQAAYRKKWKEENRDRINAVTRERRARHVEKYRAKEREKSTLYTYGITLQQKSEMLEKQGGCAACGGNNPGSVKGWHIDHCHKTGRIRGILCHPCNAALGNARDSVERLKQLMQYLRKHEPRGDDVYIEVRNA